VSTPNIPDYRDLVVTDLADDAAAYLDRIQHLEADNRALRRTLAVCLDTLYKTNGRLDRTTAVANELRLALQDAQHELAFLRERAS